MAEAMPSNVVDIRTRRKRTSKDYLTRHQRLKSKRSSDGWLAHWREIAELCQPRRMRGLSENKKAGRKVNQKIINSTQVQASRILRSGMMSGMSSQARPWFRLGLPDVQASKDDKNRIWLHTTEEDMRAQMSRSNVYDGLGQTYNDLGLFGISCGVIEEDDETVFRWYHAAPGTYCFALSDRGKVDTVYIERRLSVSQIAEWFTLKNASSRIKGLYEKGELDVEIDLLWVIEPNTAYDPTQKGRAGKRWSSCWIEIGHNLDLPPLGERNGYEEFPAMCPRWDVTDNDEYGESPAMNALGDIKMLQQIEKRKLSMLDQIGNPAMKGPPSLENKHHSTRNGDMTFVDETQGGKFEPVVMVDPKAVFLREEIDTVERRVMKAFYADLFLMFAQAELGQPITAREVQERAEEKLIQLGPVLERLHDELLKPLIDRVFGIMYRRGLIAEAPEDIAGMDLRIEFISILASAQKLLGTAAVERLAAFVGEMSKIHPEATDKLDSDAAIDDYADMLGTNPDLVRSGDDLAAKRQQRAQQEQMAAMAAMAKPASDAANAANSLTAGQPEALGGLLSAIGQ